MGRAFDGWLKRAGIPGWTRRKHDPISPNHRVVARNRHMPPPDRAPQKEEGKPLVADVRHIEESYDW